MYCSNWFWLLFSLALLRMPMVQPTTDTGKQLCMG
jgi:hypothetical protein